MAFDVTASRAAAARVPARLRATPVGVGTSFPVPWELSAFVALVLTAWIALPLFAHLPVPADNLEQLDWSAYPALGYAKHPPLPSLVMWAIATVLPAGVPLTYVLGGLCVMVMLGVSYGVSLVTMDRHRAALAVLLVCTITYYTNRLHFYNHNTALLVVSALAILQVRRVALRPAPGSWALLGALWGIGMLCKYQMVVTMACNLLFLVVLRPAPLARLAAGALLAAATAGLVLAPHVQWLSAHDWPTFGYASHSLGAALSLPDRAQDVASFLASQAGRLLPGLALILLVTATLRGARRPRQAVPGPKPTRAARLLLALHAWPPFAIMVAMSLFAGVDLQMHWGTAFLWMLPVWLLSLPAARRFAARVPFATALAGTAALQAVMLMVALRHMA